MARDPDSIQREIKKERDALAEDLDALTERASPRRFVDQYRTRVQQRLADPKVKYGLIAVGVLIALAVLRKHFADADAPPASIEQWLESRLDDLDLRLAQIEADYPGITRRDVAGQVAAVLHATAIELDNGRPVPIGVRRTVRGLADALRREMAPRGD